MDLKEAIRELISHTQHDDNCGIIPCACGLSQAKSTACALAGDRAETTGQATATKPTPVAEAERRVIEAADDHMPQYLRKVGLEDIADAIEVLRRARDLEGNPGEGHSGGCARRNETNKPGGAG